MNYILFIIDGHWIVFSIFVFINNAAVIICGQVFVWMYAFISVGFLPWGGIAGE